MSETILTDEEIAFYHREGYLAIDALTTSDDVAFIREAYDRIFAERAGRAEGAQFDLAGTDEEGQEAALPQILNPARYAPEINDSLLLKNARIAIQQLLGDDAPCHFAHAIYKPAKYGSETPWHQDASYWNPNVITRSISIWVPLQEATPANGCMHFVPRSQQDEAVLPHRSINNDPRIHGMELHPDEMDKVADAVACPLPPGGATFHNGYMLHYTPPNRSEIPRRAIILSGRDPRPVERETPISFPWQEEKRTARMERVRKATKQA